jgi:hypothetical protein
MPETTLDGAIIYREPDTFTDVLFNGQSVIDMQLCEVKRYNINGWGYIMCLRTFDTRTVPAEKMIDGQYLTHTYHGYIEVVP